MNNNVKIKFFSRVWLAITDFRLYPFILKEKALKAVSYFMKLILICCAVLSIYLIALFMDFLETGIKDFEDKVPEFRIEDGVFYSSGDTEQAINANVSLIIKDDYMQNVTVSGLGENRLYFVATKDKLLIMVRGMEVSDAQQIEYNRIGDMTKESFLNDIKSMNDSIEGKLGMAFGIFLVAFTYMLISRLWTLVMYAIVILIFNFLFIQKVKVKDLFKIAVYISTLPIILESFAITIGGSYNSTADFICFLIASVYAFYALRAITLDNVYNNTPGETPEEKIINAIKNAQDELEKQLEDIKEQERQKKEAEEEEKKTKEKSEKEDEEETPKNE